MPNLFRSFYPVSVRMSVRDLYSMITNLIDYRGPLQKSRHGVFSPNKPRQRAESAYAHPPVIDRILARSSATPLVPSVVCLIGLSLSMKTIIKNLRVQSYLVAFLRLLHCRRS